MVMAMAMVMVRVMIGSISTLFSIRGENEQYITQTSNTEPRTIIQSVIGLKVPRCRRQFTNKNPTASDIGIDNYDIHCTCNPLGGDNDNTNGDDDENQIENGDDDDNDDDTHDDNVMDDNGNHNENDEITITMMIMTMVVVMAIMIMTMMVMQ